jgi:flagellar protein FlgJ
VNPVDLISAGKTQGEAVSRLAASRQDQLSERLMDSSLKTDEELKSLALQFESIFVHYLMKSMRETIPKSGLLNSFSSDMYQSMFDQELAGEVSRQKGIGLADSLYRDLKRLDDLKRREGERPQELIESADQLNYEVKK